MDGAQTPLPWEGREKSSSGVILGRAALTIVQCTRSAECRICRPGTWLNDEAVIQ